MKKYVLSIMAVMIVLQFNVPEVFSENGGHSSLSAGDVTYAKDIKPVVEQKCMKCHGSDSPEHPEFAKDKKGYQEKLKGPRMDTYTGMISFVGWPEAGAIMRRLDDGKNTKDGKPGNMYQNLGDTEEERQKNLALFKGWVGNWTLKRWKEISKEELDGIKVKY